MERAFRTGGRGNRGFPGVLSMPHPRHPAGELRKVVKPSCKTPPNFGFFWAVPEGGSFPLEAALLPGDFWVGERRRCAADDGFRSGGSSPL